MEVHHHAQHGKKKWTEYFWEFLMLFLAVFCGFLAENQREHLVEAKRAKVYAKGLLKDLQADTVEVSTAIRSEIFRRAAMDSIIAISKNLSGLTVPGKFYYYSRFVSNLYTVDWNNSTINQLVQSGNLRLFDNKELIDKVNAYFATQNVINRATQISHERRMKVIEARSRILKSKYYSLFAGANFMIEQNREKKFFETDSLMKRQYPIESSAALSLDEYINLLLDWRWFLDLHLNSTYPNAIGEAKQIIEMLKTEYHF